MPPGSSQQGDDDDGFDGETTVSMSDARDTNRALALSLRVLAHAIHALPGTVIPIAQEALAASEIRELVSLLESEAGAGMGEAAFALSAFHAPGRTKTHSLSLLKLWRRHCPVPRLTSRFLHSKLSRIESFPKGNNNNLAFAPEADPNVGSNWLDKACEMGVELARMDRFQKQQQAHEQKKKEEEDEKARKANDDPIPPTKAEWGEEVASGRAGRAGDCCDDSAIVRSVAATPAVIAFQVQLAFQERRFQDALALVGRYRLLTTGHAGSTVKADVLLFEAHCLWCITHPPKATTTPSSSDPPSPSSPSFSGACCSSDCADDGHLVFETDEAHRTLIERTEVVLREALEADPSSTFAQFYLARLLILKAPDASRPPAEALRLLNEAKAAGFIPALLEVCHRLKEFPPPAAASDEHPRPPPPQPNQGGAAAAGRQKAQQAQAATTRAVVPPPVTSGPQYAKMARMLFDTDFVHQAWIDRIVLDHYTTPSDWLADRSGVTVYDNYTLPRWWMMLRIASYRVSLLDHPCSRSAWFYASPQLREAKIVLGVRDELTRSLPRMAPSLVRFPKALKSFLSLLSVLKTEMTSPPEDNRNLSAFDPEGVTPCLFLSILAFVGAERLRELPEQLEALKALTAAAVSPPPAQKQPEQQQQQQRPAILVEELLQFARSLAKSVTDQQNQQPQQKRPHFASAKAVQTAAHFALGVVNFRSPAANNNTGDDSDDLWLEQIGHLRKAEQLGAEHAKRHLVERLAQAQRQIGGAPAASPPLSKAPPSQTPSSQTTKQTNQTNKRPAPAPSSEALSTTTAAGAAKKPPLVTTQTPAKRARK